MNHSTAPTISPDVLFKSLNEYTLVDVRRPDEWTGELGYITDSKLITQGPDLTQFINKAPAHRKYVFVCRSGRRSDDAALEAIKHGLQNSFNLIGGMILWNEMGLPVEKK